MDTKLYDRILNRSAWIGDCLFCSLTPSQKYAFIKNIGPAHRVVWELYNGPAPAGMFVCHKCDNPRCVYIEHLFLGTPQDNMTDKVNKGRQHFGGPGRETCADVRLEMIKLRGLGYTYQEIGETYGVSRRTVQREVEQRS
jgi:HNH endonuclease/Homeodomain-like domain